ncbi:hypothetical protein [Nocardia sputorum]|nr:hypothetical protein [Nocardia sputorum]
MDPYQSPGGLLIRKAFGESPAMMDVDRVQRVMRQLVSVTVRFSVSEILGDADEKHREMRDIPRAPMGETQEEEFSRILAESSQHQKEWQRTDAQLRIATSVMVNPWIEVISYIATGGLGLAIAQGLGMVPKLLDLGIRVSTLGPEREIRMRELRNHAANLDDEYIQILSNSTTRQASAASSNLR